MKQLVNSVSIIAFVLLFLSTKVAAQNLTLFEPVEIPNNGANPSAAEIREQRNLPNVPAFTLLGTSRIGSKLKASLVDNNGEVVQVVMTDADSTPIPGYAGYNLVQVDSRTVAISQPTNTPCVASSDKGVECSSDGLTQLSLTTAAPIAVAPTAVAAAESNDEIAAAAGEDEPDNPFAAALRAAAQNESATRGRGGRAINERFEVRRIAPGDIPEGMRVVRTPFGDRLVDL